MANVNLYKYPFCNTGFCCCCDREVNFIAEKEWYRDWYICDNCKSIPRERAMMYIIETLYPDWEKLSIHESSPVMRGCSIKMKERCKGYIATQFWANLPRGKIVSGFRNENLEEQTFENNAFDIVVTQDVFEHLFNPNKGFAEIARTLKPGGAHIFTVPLINKSGKSERWARLGQNGEICFLHEPEFHGNPIDNNGSPVTYHWGNDIVDYIYNSCGMISTIYYIDNIELGIRAEYIEVIVSKKY